MEAAAHTTRDATLMFDTGSGCNVSFFFGSVALMSVGMGNLSKSADLPISMPLKAPVAPTTYDWSGFYLGPNVGYAIGTSAWSATQPGGATNLGGSLSLFNSFDAFTGTGSYFTGLQAGYNYATQSRFVFGVEADIAAPNTIAGTSTISSVPTGQAEYGETVLQSGTVRGRVGYAFANWLLYGTGGFGWTYDQLSRSQISDPAIGSSAPAGLTESALLWRFGWAAGAGVEVGITPNWSAKLEYLTADFGRSSVTFPVAAQRFDSDLLMQYVPPRPELPPQRRRREELAHRWTVGAECGQFQFSRTDDLHRSIRVSVSRTLRRPEQP
jgi:high affinity Mn2+ porin